MHIRLVIGGRGFDSLWVLQHSFVEVDREIFSMVILSLPLIIQERQLSILAQECAQILVNCLEEKYWLAAQEKCGWVS